MLKSGHRAIGDVPVAVHGGSRPDAFGVGVSRMRLKSDPLVPVLEITPPARSRDGARVGLKWQP